MVAEILRGDRRLLETFPHKELQDYWGSRPRYEDGTSGGHGPANSKLGASGSGLQRTLTAEEDPNEPPPPPYTLEEKSPSPTQDGFLTAPTSPNQQDLNVSDLANDLGRHTLGSPPANSPSHPHIPGGFNSQSTSPFHANPSPTTGPPPPVLANKPISSPQPTTPLTTPPLSSYFSPPFGPSQDVGMPSVPVPQVSHGTSPHHHSVNPNTPFHWNDDYPNPQSQPPGGYNAGTPTNPWDPQASTEPQDMPFQSGYQSSYGSPPPPPQHTRPPVHAATKPMLPPRTPHEGMGTLDSSPSFNGPGNSPPGGYSPPYPPSQSTYPGQVGPGSYYGYDQKTDGKGNDVWGGPPPSNSSYPGSGYPQHSSYPGQTHGGRPPLSNPSPLSQDYGQYQSSYPGMMDTPTPGVDRPPSDHPARKHSGPRPVSNSPPLSQGPGGYGQHQFPYPGMTSSPTPGLPDRPPTRPPTSQSPPLSQGYGQHQSSYPGMSNSPAPPDRPPTSHSSRPTTPYHQGKLPTQAQPPLPGGYNYSGPTQSTYGGMNPSASPPPVPTYQPTGPGPYGYPQQQQSTYPGYNPSPPGTSPHPGHSGSHPAPPLPPRKCHSG